MNAHRQASTVGLRPARVSASVLRRLLLAALAVSSALVLWAPSTASAAFNQPATCQIRPGAGGMPSDFEPRAVAVDGSGNVWVGVPPAPGPETDPSVGTLFDFNSACDLLGPEPGPLPRGLEGSLHAEPGLTEPFGVDKLENLSIDRMSGDFYVSGNTRGNRAPFIEVYDETGALQPWNEDEFGSPAYVAVDNSTDSLEDPSACGTALLSPSECILYISHAEPDAPVLHSEELPPGIERFTTSGAAVGFEGCGTCSSYVHGNEITGTPTRPFENFNGPFSIALDSAGDIYAIAEGVVDEFAANGEFIRAFDGEETPGIDGSKEPGGWGGSPRGVAVDPVNDVLAVSVSTDPPGSGVVDEFDASSGRFLNQITTAQAEVKTGVLAQQELAGPREMAFDAQGDLFVVDVGRDSVDAYGPGSFVPSLRAVDVSALTSSSATLNASVNPQSSSDPEQTGLAECYFQYVTEAAFQQEGFSNASVVPCTPPAGSIEANDAYQAIHAAIEGLTPGATYRYQAVASIAGKLGGAAHGEVLAFTAPHAPRVDSLSVANRSSQYADLHAQIDPLGADTTYSFQYVDDADYNAGGYAHAQATSTVDIGSGGPTGNADAAVVQQVGGLTPGTVYHVRVLAENLYGAAEEREQTFTTLAQAPPGLPDGRAYELVTPPDKEGAADMFAAPENAGEFPNRDVGYPSDSGDGFMLETNAAFGPFAASLRNVYVFDRDFEKGEWTYRDLASPTLGLQSVSSPVFDPADLSKVGFMDILGSNASEAGSSVTSLFGAPGGPYETVFSASEIGGTTTIAGASRDLGRMVLYSQNHTAAPEAGSQDAGAKTLYEWDGEGQCSEETENCRLVGIAPEGTPFKCGALLGQNANDGEAHNAVSANGSKIFFTAPNPYATDEAEPGCRKVATKTRPEQNPPQLYMRSEGATVEISAPEPGWKPEGPIKPAIYVGTSVEDSQGDVKVFFLTETELTKDDAGLDKSAATHDPELYEYDTQTAKLTRISAGMPGSPVSLGGTGAQVVTVPAISADGTAVYFTAFNQLTADTPAREPQETSYLYRYDVASATTTYVATVSTQDYPNEIAGSWWSGAVGLPSEVALNLEDTNWYTTPDGRYLLFGSTRELVAGDSTAGSCPAVGSSGSASAHCVELYRYRYEPGSQAGGSIVCVSCNPSGEPPVSNAGFTGSTAADSTADGPPRAMSDDGSYVFFNSADALVSQDDNRTQDVYEWHEGHVSLISSGQDADPSFFLGASADGADVFFGTHAQLVSRDADTNGDVYDARICTASEPCIKPPPGKTVQCEGDACQNPPPAPAEASPVSLTFSGAGNVSAAPAPVVKPRKLTRAQQLAKALKACAHKPKRKRSACNARAKKRFGAKQSKAKRPVRQRHATTSRRGGR